MIVGQTIKLKRMGIIATKNKPSNNNNKVEGSICCVWQSEVGWTNLDNPLTVLYVQCDIMRSFWAPKMSGFRFWGHSIRVMRDLPVCSVVPSPRFSASGSAGQIKTPHQMSTLQLQSSSLLLQLASCIFFFVCILESTHSLSNPSSNNNNSIRMKGVANIALSVDGFIADKDGGVDWLNNQKQIPGEDYGFKEFLASVDCMIMGHKTFDTVVGFG